MNYRDRLELRESFAAENVQQFQREVALVGYAALVGLPLLILTLVSGLTGWPLARDFLSTSLLVVLACILTCLGTGLGTAFDPLGFRTRLAPPLIELYAPQITFWIYLAAIISIVGPIFMLVHLTYARIESNVSFRWNGTTFIFTNLDTERAIDHAYQGFRHGAFWLAASAQIVLGAIVCTLAGGIYIYASDSHDARMDREAHLSTASGGVARTDSKRQSQSDVDWNLVTRRVGIVVLILFLVQILVPLYQYLLRLHAASSARADALLMLRGTGCVRLTKGPPGGRGVDANLLMKYIDALTTEKVPFGKSPNTPLKDLTDLADALKKK